MAAITNFIQGFNGGARPNRFGVQIVNGASYGFIGSDASDILLCKAATVPAWSLQPAEAKYMGRTLKYPGDRTINDWTCTFYLDTNYALRKNFENWQNNMLSMSTNLQGDDYTNTFFPHVIVRHYGRTNTSTIDTTPLAAYTLKYVWPTEVSELQLSMDSDNQISEFTVTFAINDIVIGLE